MLRGGESGKPPSPFGFAEHGTAVECLSLAKELQCTNGLLNFVCDAAVGCALTV